MYYDKQGKEITLAEWSQNFSDIDYKIVKKDIIGDYCISTIWLGVDQVIFETMIFTKDKDDELDMYQERYTTEEEALAGHERAVGLVKEKINALD